MKKLALFIIILSLTACTSQPVNSKYKEKVIEEKNDVIKQMKTLHASEDLPI